MTEHDGRSFRLEYTSKNRIIGVKKKECIDDGYAFIYKPYENKHSLPSIPLIGGEIRNGDFQVKY
ncbi:MAG: hypothetical protein AABZ11_02610 [Nitrospinota bacterium]